MSQPNLTLSAYIEPGMAEDRVIVEVTGLLRRTSVVPRHSYVEERWGPLLRLPASYAPHDPPSLSGRNMSRILTNKGVYFDFNEPEKHDYPADEIAWALSNLCRFTGHVSQFYSVAQHSVLVASLLPRHLQFHGLMHDATEAYLGDVASPLKRLLPEYKKLEARVWSAIAASHRLTESADCHATSIQVHHADMRMLVTEKEYLMPAAAHQPDGDPWPQAERAPFIITPLDPGDAYELFMATYKELNDERKNIRP